MRQAVFLLAVLVPIVASAAPSTVALRTNAYPGKACKPLLPQLARDADGRLVRNLAEPVRFDLHQAVVRSLDGCPVPAILHEDVDGSRARNVVPDRGAVRLLTR